MQKTVLFGNFSQNGGGGGHPNSQNFCKITKSFLACQIHPKMLKHVFHTGGSNIWSILSIKVHLILSLSSSLREKTVCFGNFAHLGKIPKKYRFFFGVHNLWIQYSGSVVPLAMFWINLPPLGSSSNFRRVWTERWPRRWIIYIHQALTIHNHNQDKLTWGPYLALF